MHQLKTRTPKPRLTTAASAVGAYGGPKGPRTAAPRRGLSYPSHRQARLHAPFAHRAGVGTGVAPAGNAGPQSHCSQPCVGRLRLGCQVVAPRGLRACGRAEGASWLGKVRAGLRCARYIQHSGLPLRAPQTAATRKRAVASQPPACRLALLVHPRYQARGPPLTCRLPPIGEVRGHNFFRHLVAAVGRRVVPRTTAAGRVTHVRSTSSCLPRRPCTRPRPASPHPASGPTLSPPS